MVDVRTSTPRRRSSAVANSRELGGDLRHHALARLDEDEAQALDARARIEVDDVGGEVLQLGQALEPGVAGADEHVGQQRASRRLVLDRLGALERLQDLVAQRDRVGERLEAHRVLPEAGIGSAREIDPSATITWS